jgi:hypothetical protein
MLWEVARFGTWVPYDDGAQRALALAMTAVASALVVTGSRMAAVPTWVRPPVVSRRTLVRLLAVWGISVPASVAGFQIYTAQAHEVFPGRDAPGNPIRTVTLAAVIGTFVLIKLKGNRGGPARTASAVIAAVAAPMLFELPFDLVVMGRMFPAIPPDPTFYRVVFFAPLFVAELTTLALLMCSLEVRVNAWTCYALAAMFATFGVWAMLGFGYPASPSLITANVVSKLLAFATVITLFLPLRRGSRRTATSPRAA